MKPHVKKMVELNHGQFRPCQSRSTICSSYFSNFLIVKAIPQRLTKQFKDCVQEASWTWNLHQMCSKLFEPQKITTGMIHFTEFLYCHTCSGLGFVVSLCGDIKSYVAMTWVLNWRRATLARLPFSSYIISWFIGLQEVGQPHIWQHTQSNLRRCTFMSNQLFFYQLLCQRRLYSVMVVIII